MYLHNSNSCCVRQGSPASGPWTVTSCPISGGAGSERKCTMNIMRLDHPETNPHPRSVQELSSMKSVPGAKKIGDHWIRWSQQPSSLIVNVSVIWEAPRAPLSTPRSLVATRAWPLLWKLGNLVHTAYDLFMEHNWVFIFPLSLHV